MNGRTRMLEINSIGANKMYMALGTPGGNIMLVKNLRGPCLIMPSGTQVKYTMSAKATGIAKIEVAGNCAPGRIPKKFKTHTKKKKLNRNGTNFSPPCPMVSLAIPSRTKTYPTSPMFWAPRGTSLGLRNA